MCIRDSQVYRVLELSAETGKVRPLVEETSDKYVNYTRHFRRDLKDGKQMIWMSERDNWNHLYMYNQMCIRDRDTDMPVNNLVYALASPNRIGDTSWVKTGKVAWDLSLIHI